MGIAKITTYNFTLGLFKEQSVPEIYKSINNDRTGEQYVNSESSLTKTWFSNITEVKCIPEYLTPIHHPLNNGLKVLELHRINGFYIDLTGFSSAHDYIGFKMGGKQRNRLKSRINRLESCFNITYKVYFGHIEKETYETLFDSMVLLLKRRFEQKGGEFDQTAELETLKKRCYSLILGKKASFHVIYDDSRPIDICLNYHFQDVLNGSIRSYDIDYAKYGLGQIDIVKHVEWCIDNDYRILDFMWGDLPYKHDWCNSIKQLRHHIFYNPKSLFHKILVFLIISAYRSKDYIETLKKKRERKMPSKNISKKTDNTNKFEIQELDLEKEVKHILNQPHKTIDIHKESNYWLKPLVFNFQYKCKENSNAINVIRLTENMNTYLVLGKNKGIKILKESK